MDRHADLFDVVEVNAMFTRGVNFNRAAQRWASARRKPVVGNGDVHRLRQLGSTFTLVDAARDPDSICDAIRQDKVTLVAQPLSWLTATRLMSELFYSDLKQLLVPRIDEGQLSVADSRS